MIWMRTYGCCFRTLKSMTGRVEGHVSCLKSCCVEGTEIYIIFLGLGLKQCRLVFVPSFCQFLLFPFISSFLASVHVSACMVGIACGLILCNKSVFHSILNLLWVSVSTFYVECCPLISQVAKAGLTWPYP